jgi:CBS domain-containing protein
VIRTLLEIRRVHVLSGDGEKADLNSVHCPEHGRTLSLEECLACADSAGLVRNAVGRIEYASCRHAGAGAEARRKGSLTALEQTPVSAVMTSDVVAVKPDVSTEVLAEILFERGFGAAPVVDAEGRPIGVVSRTDLLDQRFVAGDTGEEVARGWQVSAGRYRVALGPGVHAETPASDSVAEAMTRAAVSVSETETVGKAAALMAARGVHRVLVVSEDGRLAGIVTSSDIVRWIAERAGLRPEGHRHPAA